MRTPAPSAVERWAAVLAAALAAGVLAAYVTILDGQGDSPPAWVLLLFLAGIGAALVGAARPGTPGAPAGLLCLGLLALLSLLSIGVLLLPSVLLLATAALLRQSRAGGERRRRGP